MKLINNIKMSIDIMLRRGMRNLIIVIALVVCMKTLIGLMFVDVTIKRYEDGIDSAVADSIDNVSVLRAQDAERDKEIYQLIHENDNFVGASNPTLYIRYYEDRYPSEFLNCIRRTYGGSVDLILDSYELFRMFKPELESGVYVTAEEASVKYKNMFGCYLGADYKQCIPAGTVFRSVKTTFGTNVDLIVLGHLKKGAKIINPEAGHPEDMTIQEPYLSLDNKMLMLYSGDLDPSYYGTYFISSKCKAKDFTKDIIKSGREKGLNFTFITLGQMLKEKTSDGKLLYDLNKKMFCIIAFVSINMILCFQIMSITENNKEYGILLTNGYTSKDISLMILIENLLKFLLAFAVAFLMEYYRLKKNYSTDNYLQVFGTAEGYVDTKRFEEIFIVHTIPICFFIGLAVIFVSIIVPMIFLRRRPTYEYLRDR